MINYQTGLVILVLILPFSAGFVTAQANQTIVPIQTGLPTVGTPVIQPPLTPVLPTQTPAVAIASPIPGLDVAAVLGLAGVAYNYVKQHQNKNKQQQENEKLEKQLEEKDRKIEELTNGTLMATKVLNQTAMSLKATDKGDERFARILYTLINQMAKNETFKPLLNEKIKTTDNDIFFNNKSIMEIIQNNYEHTVTENKMYYDNLNPSLNDTCENRIIKSLSLADKVTTRG